MQRAWAEAGISQPRQQVVRAAQAVLGAELLLQDPHHVLATQRAHAVLRTRTGVQSLTQLCFAIPRQLRWTPGPGTRLNRIDPAVAIGVGPVLHAASGPPQGLCDLRRLFATQGQQDRTPAIASQRVPFFTRSPRKLVDVPRGPFRQIHRHTPLLEQATSHATDDRASACARINLNPYYLVRENHVKFVLERSLVTIPPRCRRPSGAAQSRMGGYPCCRRNSQPHNRALSARPPSPVPPLSVTTHAVCEILEC